MVIYLQNYLQRIASLLNVQLGKLNIKENSLCTRVKDNKSISGIINIITSLLAESNSSLAGINHLEKVEVQQWIEYGIVYAIYVDNNINHILSELNGILATKTYLVSYKLTIADILLYYILLNTMASLSSLEKEKYVNVSRWFDNLQQDPLLGHSNNLINFSTNYLVTMVPVKH